MQKLLVPLLALCVSAVFGQPKIDRRAVVGRHNVHLAEADTLASLSLGNGRFAMTMDVTGLQTFPAFYKKGIPLGTQSEWGWHSFPNSENYRIEETMQPLASHGRTVPYARHDWPDNTRAGQAARFVRQNPHRIHLANIGWHIEKTDGRPAAISDIKNIDQTLDLWNGELLSRFEVEGEPVEVVSVVGQEADLLAVKIKSNLIGQGRIGLDIKFPYPTGHFLDEAALYDPQEPSRLAVRRPGKKFFSIKRRLGKTTYFTEITSSENVSSIHRTGQGFLVKPAAGGDAWAFTCSFSEKRGAALADGFDKLRKETNSRFHTFWQSGGMIDFGETTGPQAAELERRMVLSLYLTYINCQGSTPPQETGLAYNSWFGRPHIEMTWWHGVHFALWGRPETLENHLHWFLKNSPTARKIAKRQGFDGVRWQKMTGPDGEETASSIGSYLIWQQPHFIYFAELLHRINEGKNTLEKYFPLVEETAAFMADFAWSDPERGRCILGPGVIPAQERHGPEATINPTYELAYWRWGLEAAQLWRQRMNLPRVAKWDEVLEKLSPLPQLNGLYLATENTPDSYETEELMTDHPSLLGAYGMLPATEGLDKTVMRRTLEKIWNDWDWEETWGWDFPMTAMTAARLGDPDRAVTALLMPVATNTYLKNGHNYQDERLRVYLPGNGGLLAALAMMAAGTGEGPTGFPAGWKVRFEGLNKMP